MNRKEMKRLETASQIYSTEDGRLNRDIISYNSAKLIAAKFKGGRAIQLGIGDGYIAEKVCDCFNEFCVIEGSDQIIRRFRNINRRIKIIHSLFEDFRADQEFDFLLGNHVLEHVDHPVAILKRSRSWLKRGAKALFTVPHAHSLHRRIGVRMGIMRQPQELNQQDRLLGHRRVYTIPQLERDIRKGGYSILEVKGYILKLVPNRLMADWQQNLLDAIFEVSLEVPPDICSNIAVFCKA